MSPNAIVHGVIRRTTAGSAAAPSTTHTSTIPSPIWASGSAIAANTPAPPAVGNSHRGVSGSSGRGKSGGGV
ncbi:hypothetical protein ACFSTC_48270 [Nonomuraea ferruginea]